MRRPVDGYADDGNEQHRREGEREENTPERFDRLFAKYYKALVSYGARLTGSYEVAEDLVTDAFIVLYDRPERWEPEETARRFLYRIVHNAAVDVLRTEGGRERMLQGAAESEELPGLAEASASAPVRIEREELLRALDMAIQALPPKRRAVVTLRLEQGLRNKEIAEILGVAVKTVELHLALSLKDLRQALAPFGEDPESI